MDFSGIIAGAMSGGGRALQKNALGDLEKQREEALMKLEQDMGMEAIDYEYGKKADIQKAEAEAEAAQSQSDRDFEVQKMILESELENGPGSSQERVDNAYERAMSRAEKAYSGAVDIASSSLKFGNDRENDPAFDRMAAAELRAEAEATDDPEVKASLMRYVDVFDRSGSGNAGGSDGAPDPLGIR